MAELVRGRDDIVPHGDQGVVIEGPPSSLRGQVTLRNAGTQRSRVRRAKVNAVGDVITPDMGVECRVSSGRSEPGAVVTADVFLELPPSTPPGEHTAEIEINGVPVEATIIVAEVVGIEVSPDQLVIESQAKGVVTKRIAVRNTGNVPLTVGEIGAVVLDDELLDCRTLRGALAEVAGPELSVERALGALSSHASAALDQAGVLRVHNATGTQTVEPGAIQMFDLEIRLPSKLDRHSRYFGVARIYTEDLAFVVVPGGGGTVEPA